MRKILIAHPFKQHSFHLATALNNNKELFAYCTTVYDKRKSITGRIKMLLKGDILKKASGRRCSNLDDDQVYQFCEIRGLLALLINRISFAPNFIRCYQRYLYKSFGIKVAQFALKNNVDVVIMYDTTATACFEVLKEKAPNIKLVLDMSTCTRDYAKQVFENDMKITGIEYFKQIQRYLWNSKVLNYMEKENELADHFIVASKFVYKSLLYCKVPEWKVSIVPYGVNTSDFRINNDYKHEVQRKKLKVVFVGQVDYRKGIHHLLNVVSLYDANYIEINLVGTYDSTSDLYKRGAGMKNVHFCGFITKEKLSNIYNDADVFVFPTMCEGYGLVILEALACGLPVISTENAGGNDAIIDGYNGFVIPAGDEAALKEKIDWCFNNRIKLLSMRENARKSVLNYTWDAYYQRVREMFYKII